MTHDPRPAEEKRKYGIGIFPYSHTYDTNQQLKRQHTFFTKRYKEPTNADTDKEKLWRKSLRDYSKITLPKDIKERPKWNKW